MKKILLLMLAVSSSANAVIIAPNGEVTYVNETPSGYTTVNATTNQSVFYMQSGAMTTVIPNNSLGQAQNYITSEGEQPLLIDQEGEE